MKKNWYLLTASMLLSLFSTNVSANVRFIVNNEYSPVEFDLGPMCAQMGFGVAASGCAEGMVGNSCPYTSDYVDACLTPEEWCIQNGYPKIAADCVLPEYPQDVCPKNDSYYKSCVSDVDQACRENDYFLVCGDVGKILDSSASGCPYNNSYKPCICDPCEGYTYTLAEATEQGYVAGPHCNSCGTVKYMRFPADCGNYQECECGGIGASCWSGTKKMFESCQSCCENRCSIAYADRQEGILYEHEECSDKYCDVGCAMNYEDLDNYWCDGALRCLVK